MPTVVTTHKTPFPFYLKAEGMFTLPATKQEVFDIVFKHLLKQGRKSMGDHNGIDKCLYRSPDGAKCAAGALIPDECYTPKMEGLPWASLVFDAKVPERHSDLISSLQFVHDRSEPCHWYDRLENVASRFGLTIPEIENA